jgi:hypothetical protein
MQEFDVSNSTSALPGFLGPQKWGSSKAMVKSNGDKGSPSFRPLFVENISGKYLPMRTLQ